MKTTLSVLALVGGLAFLPGCSSTPQWRISENPGAFSRLAPEQQQLVREGKIALGFDAEAVKLALGEPDRIREHTDAEGTRVLWSYMIGDDTDELMFYDGTYNRRYPYASPYYPYVSPYYPYYSTPYYSFPALPHSRGYERFRVVFREGKVISFENRMK
jgi:hypothetical protein